MLNAECRGSEEHGALFVVVLVHDNAERIGRIPFLWQQHLADVAACHHACLVIKTPLCIYKSCAEALQCMFSGAVSLLCGSGVQDVVRGFPPEGHIT